MRVAVFTAGYLKTVIGLLSYMSFINKENHEDAAKNRILFLPGADDFCRGGVLPCRKREAFWRARFSW